MQAPRAEGLGGTADAYGRGSLSSYECRCRSHRLVRMARAVRDFRGGPVSPIRSAPAPASADPTLHVLLN